MGWAEILDAPERREPVPNGPILDGSRDMTLTRIAGAMRHIGASEAEVLAALRETNKRCEPPLVDSDLRRIAHSVARYAPAPEPIQLATSSKATTQLAMASSIVPRRVRWLWRDRLALGKVVMLDGRPGLGKSSMALDIAARVSTGSAMPDGFDPNTGAANVVVVTAEDDWEDTVVPRLMAAGADLSRVYRLDELSLPDGVDRLEELLAGVGAVFCAIDPLVAFVPAKYDLYKDQSARLALKPLSMAASRLGAAVLGLRHVNKAANISAQDRGTGSVAIGGSARANLIVGPDPDMTDRFVLASIKNNLGPRPPSLNYRLTPTTVTLPDGAASMVAVDWLGEVDLNADDLVSPDRQGEAVKFLLAVLADGPVPTKDVEKRAKDAGLSWVGAVRRASERIPVVKSPAGFGGEWTWSLPS